MRKSARNASLAADRTRPVQGWRGAIEPPIHRYLPDEPVKPSRDQATAEARGRMG